MNKNYVFFVCYSIFYFFQLKNVEINQNGYRIYWEIP